MDWAAAYLLKSAVLTALPSAWEQPLTDKTPDEFTRTDARTLQGMYNKLPAAWQRVADAGRNARLKVRSR
jgi:hypothetical protein